MSSIQDTVDNIKSVKIQGAREIAIYALKFLQKFCEKEGFTSKFDAATTVLEETRPTAVVLHNILNILKKERNMETINSLLKELDNATKKISINGNKIIQNNYLIMTHCHSGEAMSVIKQANISKKNVSVIATETEPLEQGIKTAKEMAKNNIDVTLITDSAAGHFMKDVDMVLVGSDALRKEGVINKIGTVMLAIAAKAHKKPFYVAANHFKFDKRKKIVIEERPTNEVHTKIKGVKIRNPAFDVTPWKYVTAVITDNGIFKPEEIKRFL